MTLRSSLQARLRRGPTADRMHAWRLGLGAVGSTLAFVLVPAGAAQAAAPGSVVSSAVLGREHRVVRERGGGRRLGRRGRPIRRTGVRGAHQLLGPRRPDVHRACRVRARGRRRGQRRRRRRGNERQLDARRAADLEPLAGRFVRLGRRRDRVRRAGRHRQRGGDRVRRQRRRRRPESGPGTTIVGAARFSASGGVEWANCSQPRSRLGRQRPRGPVERRDRDRRQSARQHAAGHERPDRPAHVERCTGLELRRHAARRSTSSRTRATPRSTRSRSSRTARSSPSAPRRAGRPRSSSATTRTARRTEASAPAAWRRCPRRRT